MKNPLYISKSYFSGQNLAKFLPLKKYWHYFLWNAPSPLAIYTPSDCPSSSFDMSRFDFVAYNLLGLLRFSIALKFKGHIIVIFEPCFDVLLG
jgi:hypothetical protein